MTCLEIPAKFDIPASTILPSTLNRHDEQALSQGDPLSGIGLSKDGNPQVSVTDPKELHCESEPFVAPKGLVVDFF